MSESIENPNAHEEKSPNISITELVQDVPRFRKPLAFKEWFSSKLVSRLLWFICALAVGIIVVWLSTRPTLADAHSLTKSTSTTAKVAASEVVETLRTLRKDHFEQFKSLFQLIVLSGLVPLFTLMAGYAFGGKEREGEENE